MLWTPRNIKMPILRWRTWDQNDVTVQSWTVNGTSLLSQSLWNDQLNPVWEKRKTSYNNNSLNKQPRLSDAWDSERQSIRDAKRNITRLSTEFHSSKLSLRRYLGEERIEHRIKQLGEVTPPSLPWKGRKWTSYLSSALQRKALWEKGVSRT